MDIAVKARDGDAQIETLFQVLDVAVQEMVGPLVRLVDERIVHVEHFDVRRAFLEGSDERIILPEGVGRGADVGLKPAGVGGVQIADSRGQHQDVAGTLKRFEDETLHRKPRKASERCERNLNGRPRVVYVRSTGDLREIYGRSDEAGRGLDCVLRWMRKSPSCAGASVVGRAAWWTFAPLGERWPHVTRRQKGIQSTENPNRIPAGGRT
jgi:hypothetical protein